MNYYEIMNFDWIKKLNWSKIHENKVNRTQFKWNFILNFSEYLGELKLHMNKLL